MKKRLLFFFVLSIIGLSTKVQAYDFSAVCSSGQTLYYNITSTTAPYKAYITSQNTTEPFYSLYPTGNLVIPNTVSNNGNIYIVDSIGSYAFLNCGGLTSITIPNSVTSIGIGALKGCISLNSINVDSNNVKYSSADGVLFNKNADTLIKCPVRKQGIYNIPNSVISIIGEAFSNCELTSVIIPNSVTSIGDYVFSYCVRLTSITISNSVTAIGEYAFINCTGLTSIIIPNSVTKIGDNAFTFCSGLTSINVGSNNTKYSSVDGVLLNKNADTLITCPEGKLGVYNIPNTITSISESAFTDCKLLSSVIIPNSVTSIGIYAFADCELLDSITIPNSVTTIGIGAFFYCIGLNLITIPSSVTSIGYGAFKGTPFYNNKPDGIIYINNVLYEYKGTMPANTIIDIPLGIVSISPAAFTGCDEMISITIPNSVVEIGEGAFFGCSGINTITIPSYITSIESVTFSFCSGLTSVIIPDSVTSIGGRAFMGCSGLTSITIPNSVTKISDSAFYDCIGLDSIICEAITPPSILELTFENVDRTIPIYIPCGSLSLYQEDQYWNEFTNYKCLVGLDNEIETKVSTKIYPNPASDKAVLEFEGLNDDANVSVVDLLGRVIKEYKINKQDSNIEIDVRGFAKGVYNVVLRNDKMNITKKLIVR